METSRERLNLLIAALYNVIRTDYIKAKIDNTQQNSKCRFCGETEKKDDSHNEWMQQINIKGVQD